MHVKRLFGEKFKMFGVSLDLGNAPERADGLFETYVRFYPEYRGLGTAYTWAVWRWLADKIITVQLKSTDSDGHRTAPALMELLMKRFFINSPIPVCVYATRCVNTTFLENVICSNSRRALTGRDRYSGHNKRDGRKSRPERKADVNKRAGNRSIAPTHCLCGNFNNTPAFLLAFLSTIKWRPRSFERDKY